MQVAHFLRVALESVTITPAQAAGRQRQMASRGHSRVQVPGTLLGDQALATPVRERSFFVTMEGSVLSLLGFKLKKCSEVPTFLQHHLHLLSSSFPPIFVPVRVWWHLSVSSRVGFAI